MNDHFNLATPVKEAADLNGFEQGPLCGGHILCGNQHCQNLIWDWDIMPTTISNGMGIYPMLPYF